MKKQKPIRNKEIEKRKKLEKFVLEQFEEYMKLHKEHEKDLSYIG